MPHEVIMPALGMAQDTGLLVAWHKAPGDAVRAGDILFEVETDKATMEVECSVDGYVASLLAEVGEEAPVGDVIALISTEKPENPTQASRTGKARLPAEPSPSTEMEAREEAAESPLPTNEIKQVEAAQGGRVLASPKARRMALERGLDLSQLAAAGYRQPYHAADLEGLRARGAEAGVAGAQGSSQFTARVPSDGFLDFQSWLENVAPVSTETILAGFAAASLRCATDAETVTVRADQPILGRSTYFADPDLMQFSKIVPCDERLPSVVLRDLTECRVTGVASGTDHISPLLTLVREGTSYVLTLEFGHGGLSADMAIQFLDGFAERLGDPLHHLL